MYPFTFKFNIVFVSLVACFCLLFTNCTQEEKETTTKSKPATKDIPLFSIISSDHSNVIFQNELKENIERTWYNFNPIYNGGGIAIGDINNDGLADLYFTGNEIPNKLYLNKGNFKFEDITEKAGVAGGKGWHNGPNMIDINGDGWLDIYVCRGGWIKDENLRSNLLFINQKDGTFKESAEVYGLQDKGFSFQSLFFDYDLDGDLDVYIVNHPGKSNIDTPDYKKGYKSGSKNSKDQLYKNNGDNTFTNVTQKAGIGGTFGFGLSVTSSDLDNNGYPDIYISNDYTEPDYLFMNNGDGTFTNKIKEMTEHISLFAMGADISDFNNDGLEDIFVTEMLPADYKRTKTMMPSMNPERFEFLIEEGFHRQNMHNSLQLNRGNGHFSEISQMAGLSTTDWSWACFLIDLDNDGLRDAFVSNGYKRDLYDKDSAKDRQEYFKKNNGLIRNIDEFLKLTPVTKSVNLVYKNKNGFKFIPKSKDWGINQASFSNGASYADLDNDGDLDLVVNNFDEPSFLYKNNAEQLGTNYLRIKLIGPLENPAGIGSSIQLHYGNQKQFEHFKTTRGYLSSVEPIAHFGLGEVNKIDKIEVKWFDGTSTILRDIPANQVIEIKYTDAKNTNSPSPKKETIFAESTKKHFPQSVVHKENQHDDYKYQILLPHRLSQLGPFVSTGDVNGDGREDCYIGGAKGQAGQLRLQNTNEQFLPKRNPAFDKDRSFEDMGSLLFDADGDGDLDLYVVSGGTEETNQNPFYQDRLYLNDGKGNFTKSPDALPQIGVSGSCVIAEDYDGDGDQDLFVGGRVVPNLYPYPTQSFLLQNNNGKFTNVNKTAAPYLDKFGLVTDAIWTDIDQDGAVDLLVTGEWLPLTVLLNKNGTFVYSSSNYKWENSRGWWNTIEEADLDGDGDMDYIVGNLGWNYKFKASEEKPFHVYLNDFDGNGSYDIFLAKNYNGLQVPIRGRECSAQQLPSIATTFETYHAFADADINQLLGPKIEESLHYEATNFSSVILRNNNGQFTMEELPSLAQLSTINGIVVKDFSKDGIPDILVAGNMYHSEVETTRADASVGLLLIGQKDGQYKPMSVEESGVFLPYDVKSLETISIGNSKEIILVTSNDDILRSLDF